MENSAGIGEVSTKLRKTSFGLVRIRRILYEKFEMKHFWEEIIISRSIVSESCRICKIDKQNKI